MRAVTAVVVHNLDKFVVGKDDHAQEGKDYVNIAQLERYLLAIQHLEEGSILFWCVHYVWTPVEFVHVHLRLVFSESRE